MVRSSKIEIEKFNVQIFELWKLNLEDLLVEKDQWIVVDPCTSNIHKLIRRRREQSDCVSQIQYY
jgi:hypothetical protein